MDNEFIDYVYSFYGPNGLYPMQVTIPMIKEATQRHIKIQKLKEHKFLGDSYDRECVRDLMISKYKL